MAIKCLSSVRTGIVNSSFLVHVLLTFLAWMFTPVWKFKKKIRKSFGEQENIIMGRRGRRTEEKGRSD